MNTPNASITESPEMSMTISEYREVQAAHPNREIRIGDGLLIIDVPCMACKGLGGRCQWQNEGPWVPCPECDGHGRRLTAEGQVLVAAMREWLGDRQVRL